MHRFRSRLKLALIAALVLVTLGAAAGALAVYLHVRGAPVPVGMPTPAPAGDEWIDLLDGSNAQAWRNVTDDKSIYEIHDGVLHIFGRSVLPLRYAAFTGRSFGDFELHVEFKLAEGANSGLFLRAQSDDPVQRGFEIQVLDDFGRRPDKHGSGAIYDVVTPMFNLSRPAGEWNSYDVRVVGTKIDVVMNGWLVVQADFARMTELLGKFDVAYADLPRDGMIMIQDHGGEAWFRNLRVRPIPAPLEPSLPQPEISPRGE